MRTEVMRPDNSIKADSFSAPILPRDRRVGRRPALAICQLPVDRLWAVAAVSLIAAHSGAEAVSKVSDAVSP